MSREWVVKLNGEKPGKKRLDLTYTVSFHTEITIQYCGWFFIIEIIENVHLCLGSRFNPFRNTKSSVESEDRQAVRFHIFVFISHLYDIHVSYTIAV